jgi:hypothetical protein
MFELPIIGNKSVEYRSFSSTRTRTLSVRAYPRAHELVDLLPTTPAAIVGTLLRKMKTDRESNT